jgi:hydrogenase 3 maturation protease
MVDATDMGLNPGAIRRIARDQVEDVGIGTHMLPLYHLIDYLAEVTTDIVLIGIQPKSVGYGEPLCEEVQAAAEAVADLIATDRMDEIEPLAEA